MWLISAFVMPSERDDWPGIKEVYFKGGNKVDTDVDAEDCNRHLQTLLVGRMKNTASACDEIGMIVKELECLQMLDIGLQLPVQKLLGRSPDCHLLEFDRTAIDDAHVPLISGL